MSKLKELRINMEGILPSFDKDIYEYYLMVSENINPGAGALYLWYPGASAASLRAAPHADHSDELHVLWRNLCDSDGIKRRHLRIRTGSPVAGLGNRPDQFQGCRRFICIPESAGHRYAGPL